MKRDVICKITCFPKTVKGENVRKNKQVRHMNTEQCLTWESFICMWAKTWRKPTTASHKRLWARLCWFPVHGPCGGRNTSHVNWYANKQTRKQGSLSCNYTDLYVLSEWVEHLLGHTDGLREVLLTVFVDHCLPGVEPIEVTDGLLKTRQHERVGGKNWLTFESRFSVLAIHINSQCKKMYFY